METASLEKVAQKLRFEAVRMIYEGKDGHPGPALSIADIVAVLFFQEMNLDPKRPDWEDRDRFVLSKGHACPVYYAALNERGYFQPKVEHFQLRQLGSIFQGHPSMHSTPGVDMTSGSLGNGIAVAAGMAAAGRTQGKDFYVYCICGDGELQEGQIWEAAMTAAQFSLDNVCAVVDDNGVQLDGPTKDIMDVEPLGAKFAAFGWEVLDVDGHSLAALRDAFRIAAATQGRPTVLIAHTVKGKGVSFMEDVAGWHGKAPNDEEYKTAMDELKARLAEVEGM